MGESGRAKARLIEQLDDCHTRVALTVGSQVVGLDVGVSVEIFVDPLTQDPGALAVNDANLSEMGEDGVVKVLVQSTDSFVPAHAEELDLRRDEGGLIEGRG